MDDRDLMRNAQFSCFTRKQEELVKSMQEFWAEKGFLTPKQKQVLENIIAAYEKRELLK